MDLLDDNGARLTASFLVAAEWVGIVTERDAGGEVIRFVPGGIAHAFDPVEHAVLCDEDEGSLERFATDFGTNPWLFRCEKCDRLAASAPA